MCVTTPHGEPDTSVPSAIKVPLAHRPCAGKFAFLDPEMNRLHATFDYFERQRLKDPEHTHAVIMVPVWVGGSSWRKHLSGKWRLLEEIPSNTPLYTSKETEGPPVAEEPVKHRMQA